MNSSSYIDKGEIFNLLAFEYTDNANLQNNAETFHKAVADLVMKRFALEQLDEDLREAHQKGDLHIHDLEYFCTRPFCQDHDLRYFFYYGLLPDGTGKKASVAGPAKRPEVAVLHAVKALGAAQTNFAGGQGFYNFLTFLAPYLEGLQYDDIKQLMQMFLYEMNQMMVARGGQLVFSSVQLAPGVPTLWKDKPVVYKGKIWDGTQAPLRTYGEFEKEVRLAFQALMEVLLEGDHWRRPYSFPKPEVGLMREFMEDGDEIPGCLPYSELYLLACKVAAKTGNIYFDNMLPSYRTPPGDSVISCVQCCSYAFASGAKSDSEFFDKMYFRNGKHFSMGGMQVVTLNLPRMAYKVLLQNPKDEEEQIDLFRKEINLILEKAVRIFRIKKKWIDAMLAADKMPFITQQPAPDAPPLVDLSKLSYIVGIVGLNETVRALTGKELVSEDGQFMGELIVSDLSIKVLQLSEETGMNIQLARTPAETVAGRFAALDLLCEEYRDLAKHNVRGDITKALEMLQENQNVSYNLLPVYYTNGSHVPVNADVSLAKKLEVESGFFILLPAGNICHIFLGEKEPDAGGLWCLVKKIAQNTEIGYFAFTRDFTICCSCHHIEAGIEEVCPLCNSTKVDHLSRITGYVQPVSGWNAAKKQEFKDRRRYGL